MNKAEALASRAKNVDFTYLRAAGRGCQTRNEWEENLGDTLFWYSRMRAA